MTANRTDSTPPPLAEEAIGIDLAELETFMAVARLGSFSLAAQQMHVTQPSVTGRVQRLEASLGTALLVRTTRNVEPTSAGSALLTEASQALDGLRKLVGSFRRQARLARQRVVVAATPTIAARTLPGVIRDYSERFTDVQIVLRDLRYAEALAALEDGTADLAVIAWDGHDKRFRAEPLTSHEVVVLVPEKHALAKRRHVTVAQLAPHPLLLVEQYRPMREQIAEAAQRSGVALVESTFVDNLNTLLGMVAVGWGATLLTREIAEQRRHAQHAIVEISDLKLSRDIAVVRARKATLGTAAESFVRFLRQSPP